MNLLGESYLLRKPIDGTLHEGREMSVIAVFGGVDKAVANIIGYFRLVGSGGSGVSSWRLWMFAWQTLAGADKC